MNPTMKMRHPYTDDAAAWEGYKDAVAGEVAGWLAKAEICFTEHEFQVWDAMGSAARRCMVYLGHYHEGDEIDHGDISKRRAEFERAYVQPLIRRMEWIRTATERDMVMAQIDGYRRAMELHQHHTGIY